jgi:hypothetical protein
MFAATPPRGLPGGCSGTAHGVTLHWLVVGRAVRVSALPLSGATSGTCETVWEGVRRDGPSRAAGPATLPWLVTGSMTTPPVRR